MKALRSLLSRYPVVSYYLLAFMISWGGTLLVVGGPSRLVSGGASPSVFPIVITVTLFGPAIAGVVMTYLAGGKAGLRDLVARMVRWKVGARWYAAAVLTPALSVTAALLVLALSSPDFLPAYLTVREPAQPGSFEVTGLSILVAAVAAGFFEEIGWTGFAMPRMMARYGVAVTGIVMGILWGLWHLASNLWGSADTTGSLPLALYMGALLFTFLPPFRVLMVWVYAHTESLLIAMLMHASLVTFWLVSMPQGISGAPQATWYVVWALVLWAAVATVVVLDRPRTVSVAAT